MAETASSDTRNPIYLPAGDTALVVQFGEAVDPEINRRVRRLAAAVRAAAPEGIVDLVPTMRSLMIHFDPLVVSQGRLIDIVGPLTEQTVTLEEKARRWHIPVCYEGDCAPDLVEVARATGLAPEEVVARHAATAFEVYMMGFLPGFPYLGMLPEVFDLPRRPEPRVKVPPRSISVAARQTTIYTIESPGGWHLIGRTPVDFYDPGRAEPILVEAGDRIHFEPVDTARYEDLRRAVEARSYEPKCEIL